MGLTAVKLIYLELIFYNDVFFFRGRSLLGYHKRDIALQSSYCMIHFDDIPVLQTLHSDCKYFG